MYLVIMPNGCYRARSLKKLNKKLKMSLSDDQFKSYGNDKIAYLDDVEVKEILADKYIIEQTILSKLFKKDFGWPEMLIILNTVLILALYIK